MWNSQQESVFTALRETDDNLLITARAGTGKTSVLIEGLARVSKPNTVLLAFSNQDKDELSARTSAAKVSTVHQLGFAALGRTQEWRHAVLEKHKIMRHLERLYPKGSYEFWQNVLSTIATGMSRLATSTEDFIEIAGEFAGDDRTNVAEVAMAVMRALIEDRTAVTFDEMVWLPNVVPTNVPKYDRVFIDELQDNTPAQLRLVLKACQSRLVGVWDPAQCIYQFRGADPDMVRRVFMGMSARDLLLPISYRCARAIIREAQHHVPDIEARPDAPEGEVHHMDVDHMVSLARPGDLIISRSNAALARIRKKLPDAIIAGRDGAGPILSFIRHSHAKSVPALLTYIDTKLEADRKSKTGRALTAAEDRAAEVKAFAEGHKTIADLEQSVRQAFEEDRKERQHTRIVLSTTHQQKGRERDRVFMLDETFMFYPGLEEECIRYVAITRAKTYLAFVSGLYPD